MSETRWIVLTGAASSGKSSVLNEISRRGYATCPEAATLVLNQMDSEGKDVDQYQNTMEFHCRVEKVNREMEERFPKDKTVFLDRTLLDNLVYKQYFQDIRDDELLDEVRGKYEKVFFLERLPFELNDRDEKKEAADDIKKALKREYRAAGYEGETVPLGNVEERADFILDRVEAEKFWQEND